MKISINNKYGYVLEVQAENVLIEEDIENRIYPKKEDGKFDFSKTPERNVNVDVIDQFVYITDDLIDYYIGDYDSSDLIKRLFEKLPSSVIQELLEELKNDYII